MKLILDIGNTYGKIAIFDGDAIRFHQSSQNLDSGLLESCFQNYPTISSAIISSVANHPTAIEDFIKSKVPLFQLNADSKLPFRSSYSTPETLGKDRIAAVAGALSMFEERNILVIDAGTCITYDLVTSEKMYLGGGISPGIKMRFKSLHTFTGKLPLVEFEPKHDVDLIGNSTSASILAGVQKAVLIEVDATIDRYKERFSNLQTVVTGGDHNYLYKYLKNNIFAAPKLVLIGLKKILDYNEGS